MKDGGCRGIDMYMHIKFPHTVHVHLWTEHMFLPFGTELTVQ